MTLSIPDLKRIAEAANTQGEWEQIDYRVFTKAPDFNYVCATANNAVTRVPEQYARATHIAAMNPTRTLALLEAFEAMREALTFCELTIDHAIALDYLGEGSTRGMAVEASDNASKALAKAREAGL